MHLIDLERLEKLFNINNIFFIIKNIFEDKK